MRQERRNENRSRKKKEDKRGKHRPRWDRRFTRSLGDEEGVDPKERVAAECPEENAMCEWSHNCDESEWSLMISLIRRWGFP